METFSTTIQIHSMENLYHVLGFFMYNRLNKDKQIKQKMFLKICINNWHSWKLKKKKRVGQN